MNTVFFSPKNWGCVNGHEVLCFASTWKVGKTTGDCMIHFYEHIIWRWFRIICKLPLQYCSTRCFRCWLVCCTNLSPVFFATHHVFACEDCRAALWNGRRRLHWSLLRWQESPGAQKHPRACWGSHSYTRSIPLVGTFQTNPCFMFSLFCFLSVSFHPEVTLM